MGFPIGYSELLIPKLIIQIFFFLGYLRRSVSRAFDAAGLGDLLDTDAPWPDPPATDSDHHRAPAAAAVPSAMLIEEILPVIRFEDLLGGEDEDSEGRPVADGCAVCLYEMEARDEVRRLRNCRHVFHRCCLDRWMEHDQRTCPLCRTPLIPGEMQDAFYLRMWAAAGVPDSDAGEFPSASIFPFLPHSPPLLL